MSPGQCIEDLFLRGIFIEDEIKTIPILTIINHTIIMLQMRVTFSWFKSTKYLNIAIISIL